MLVCCSRKVHKPIKYVRFEKNKKKKRLENKTPLKIMEKMWR